MSDFNAFILLEKVPKGKEGKKKMNKKKEMCQNHFKKLMLRLSKLAILNLKARMLQMGAMHDKTNRLKYR